MDIRALECFVVIAEELHFRRAAARLNMTQPSLTARIQVLEQEVGAQLLMRDRRRVQITEAGRAFFDHATIALRSSREAVRRARRAASGEAGQLRFGFTGLTSFSGMPELVQHFRLAHPEVEIELIHAETAVLEARLLADEIDVALLHPPVLNRLELMQLAPEALVLAMPASHPLAKADAIPIERLAGEPFLIGPRANAPHLYEQIILLCREAGFSPNIVQEVTAMTTLIGLAAAGAGCGFVTSSLQVIQRPGVVYRPLADNRAPKLATALAWHAGGLSPTGARLLDLARIKFQGKRRGELRP